MAITISWMLEEDRPTESGGVEVISAFHELTLDVVTMQDRTIAADVPEHPIEDGAPIQDHVIPQARRVVLEIAISNNPINENVPGASHRSLDLGGGNTALTLQWTYSDRAQAAFDLLAWLVESGTEVDVLGLPWGDLEGYLLVNVDAPQDKDTGDGFQATLEFVKHRIVSLDEIDAPAPLVERGRRRNTRGNQPAAATEETTPSTAESTQRESIARTLLGHENQGAPALLERLGRVTGL